MALSTFIMLCYCPQSSSSLATLMLCTHQTLTLHAPQPLPQAPTILLCLHEFDYCKHHM